VDSSSWAVEPQREEFEKSRREVDPDRAFTEEDGEFYEVEFGYEMGFVGTGREVEE